MIVETLVKALGPVLVAAIAVQQLLELTDTFFFNDDTKNKKLILGIASLIIGFILTFGFGLRVMGPFGVVTADWLDAIVTAVLLSAGTEGSNSIMKLLEYYKEKLKSGE
jgi:hypothetical protein